MKRLIVILAVLFIFSIPAYAQMGSGMMGQKEEMRHGMMGEGHQIPMRQMCMQHMQHMMGHGMMVRDMQQIIIDMMKVQKKIIGGMKPSEKNEMLREMDRMMDRMEKIMSDMRGMTMKGMMAPSPIQLKKDDQTKEEAPESPPHKH